MLNQNISQTERDVDVKEVSDKCSYLITANAPLCSEQNYRVAIESGLYPLKPPQVRVPRTLIIIRQLLFSGMVDLTGDRLGKWWPLRYR